jgi:hypothetical protein
MAEKLNLNKLKDEISSRKKDKNIAPSSLGEQTTIGASPRDTFLFGLLESLKSGRDNASTNLVKTVDIKTAERKGETPKLSIRQPVQPQQNQRPQAINELSDMMPERDDLMYRDMGGMKNKTLAESIQQYTSTPVVGAPMRNQPPQQAGQLNEGFLVENVKKMVNNYLAENLEPVFEEAIKSTIIEMYAVERIKEVLHENKEMIKGLVVEVIKEIQAKAKSRAQ